MNSLHDFLKENRKPLGVFVLSLSIVLAISFPLQIFIPSVPYNNDASNPIYDSPWDAYYDQQYEEYDEIFVYNNMISKLKFAENLAFRNDEQGGATSFRIYTYNFFGLSTEIHYLRILQRISITSLLKTESYVLQNDIWILNSTVFEWRNIRECQIYMTLSNGKSNYEKLSTVSDDLIVNNSLIEKNHEWLDLGYSDIGGSKILKGYGSIEIIISNTDVKNAYFGIEVITNQTKSVYSLKKFIFRVELIWQRYENHFFGWKTLMKKAYFLGNGMLESMYGLDSSYGIDVIPSTF
jgi:hypothetical protein